MLHKIGSCADDALISKNCYRQEGLHGIIWKFANGFLGKVPFGRKRE
jgi:hypothetical protein